MTELDLSKQSQQLAQTTSALVVRSVSITGIFIILAVFALHAAADILIPITIAYSLNLLLSPLIRKLGKLRIPAPLSAAVVVISFVGISVLGIYALFEPAEEWIQRGPQLTEQVKHKIRPMLGSIEGAQKVAAGVDTLIDDKVDQEPPLNVKVQPDVSRAERMLSSTSSALASIGIVVVLLYFLLAAGDTFLNKLVSIIPKFKDKRRAVEIIREIQRDTSRYLITRTLINIGLGAVVSFALYMLGMPNPILWGTMAAVLNFAPYVGPAISLSIMTVAAIISFDTLPEALLVPLTVLLINILEGEFISHHLIGKRLALSPVIVFMSIVFWGWIWGVAGALMAIPIIAAINVVCQHVDSLNPVSEFIRDSDD
mgnify:FL=1